MEMPADEVEYLCMVFAIGDNELEPGGMDRELTAADRPEWVRKVLELYLSRSVSVSPSHPLVYVLQRWLSGLS